jgi:hypothetical protein
MPEAHRRVPSEKVEQKNPERQSASAAQVPHSSVEAHDDKAPRKRAAMRTRTRFWGMSGKGLVNSRRRKRI